MKKLEDMNPRDYGMNPREEIVAAAMKAYLLSMPDGEQVGILSEIIKPSVIKLHGEGGAPLPLQSVVEGAKLAAFIDRSLAHTVILLREHGDDLFEAMATVLVEMDGKLIVQNMSYELLSFLGDAYRAVRYGKVNE